MRGSATQAQVRFRCILFVSTPRETKCFVLIPNALLASESSSPHPLGHPEVRHTTTAPERHELALMDTTNLRRREATRTVRAHKARSNSTPDWIFKQGAQISIGSNGSTLCHAWVRDQVKLVELEGVALFPPKPAG